MSRRPQCWGDKCTCGVSATFYTLLMGTVHPEGEVHIFSFSLEGAICKYLYGGG